MCWLVVDVDIHLSGLAALGGPAATGSRRSSGRRGGLLVALTLASLEPMTACLELTELLLHSLTLASKLAEPLAGKQLTVRSSVDQRCHVQHR